MIIKVMAQVMILVHWIIEEKVSPFIKVDMIYDIIIIS